MSWEIDICRFNHNVIYVFNSTWIMIIQLLCKTCNYWYIFSGKGKMSWEIHLIDAIGAMPSGTWLSHSVILLILSWLLELILRKPGVCYSYAIKNKSLASHQIVPVRVWSHFTKSHDWICSFKMKMLPHNNFPYLNVDSFLMSHQSSLLVYTYVEIDRNECWEMVYTYVWVYAHVSYETRLQGKIHQWGPMYEYARKCIRYNIPSTVNSTPTNIIEKIYTHSMEGFSKYIKQNILQSYQENCTIYNCYICHRT